MKRQTVKTSTIFIGTRAGTRVYRSVDELSPALRKRLLDSTNGQNSATILIADRGGREELLRALRRRQEACLASPDASVPLLARLRDWGAVVLPGAIGLLVWLLCTTR